METSLSNIIYFQLWDAIPCQNPKCDSMAHRALGWQASPFLQRGVSECLKCGNRWPLQKVLSA